MEEVEEGRREGGENLRIVEEGRGGRGGVKREAVRREGLHVGLT